MFTIREMIVDDYDYVMALWNSTEGVGLSTADSREAIGRYLARNPGMSAVAFNDEGEMVGAVLCGHDGRRGFLHHLAVRQDCRQQGLGSALVDHCLDALRAEGIEKCHLTVFARNQVGRAFWKIIGWYERPELVMMSVEIPAEAEAEGEKKRFSADS